MRFKCIFYFIFSAKSFVNLAKLLLSEEGIQFVLSEKLSQDPVEEYFSKQRAKRGADENPTLEIFNRNVLGLNVAGDELIKVMNGNTRGRYKEDEKLNVNDTSRLPTKKSKLF